MLSSIGRDLWCLEGERVRMLGIPFETRMTIARLANGDLWLHSPVVASADRVEAVESLGPVRHIVAPNKFHHLFVPDWTRRFPDATSWGEPALLARRPDLGIARPLAARAPEAWSGVIDHCWFAASTVLPEFVFLHCPSRTLIVTDIIQNHDPATDGFAWRLVKRLNGILAPNGTAPRDWRLTVRDRAAARASVAEILSWEFDRIVVSHGLCVTEDARAFFERAFAWLGEN